MDREKTRLLRELEAALDGLSKAVFSQCVDSAWPSRVSVRPVLIKGGRSFQLEKIQNNKAYHENLSREDLLKTAALELDGRYRQALIVTHDSTSQFVLRRDGSYKKSGGASLPRPGKQELSHDREKEYILREGENIPALVDLGVFTREMKIVRAKYDKYKQINRFVELIDQQFSKSGMESITILDFGCGKSYLTFILYYYFSVKRAMDVKIIGYDLKEDVVERCNLIAEKYGYTGLSFVRADVGRDRLYDRDIDMIVTLHACDTATDYALDYAVKKQVKYIFSVPCCQHEVNSSIKKGGELDVFLKHGIIKERMCSLLTDSIRALVLEDMGYDVDMIEFTDFEHSPKNLMIRAELKGKRGSSGRERARALSERYGFRQTLLELEPV